MKNFWIKHTRALSLIAAALAGFGFAVPNLFLGLLCLIVALILDYAYCKLTTPQTESTLSNNNPHG